jgi:aminoglycoside phosphotransferase (APT) family kinase protein
MTTQPWGADRPLDERLVRALLADRYPDLPVRDVRFLAEGWDSQAFEIDGTWVFRFPKRADIQNDLRVEASLLPHLATHLARVGVRIPVFDFVGQPSDLFPYLFAGYRKLIGVQGTELPVDEVPVDRLCTQLGAALAAVHAFPVERARALGVPEELVSRRLGVMRDRALARLSDAAPALDAAVVASARAALTPALTPPEFAGQPVLVHNDLHEEHFLFDLATRDLVGIIDWGDVALGDPAVDLCGVFAWLGMPAAARLAAAYGAALDPGALERTRYRALCLGVYLTAFGVMTGDQLDVERGRRALALALA